MTDVERQLHEALSARARDVEIDADAWQTHLDLVRTQARSPGWATAGRRWRAPALVAASVVAVGLIGGILAQAGLAGGHTVSPAVPDSSSVTAATVTGPVGDRVTTRGGTDGPSATGRARPAPGAAVQTDRAAPSEESTVLGPPRSERSTHESGPRRTAAAGFGQGPAQQRTSQADPPAAHLAPDHSAATTAVGTAAPPTTWPVSVTALMPCGAVLADMTDADMTDQPARVSVQPGPDGAIVNAGQQPLHVVGVGYAAVDSDGHIVAQTGGSAALLGNGSQTLAPGTSTAGMTASFVPVALCPEATVEAIGPTRVTSTARGDADAATTGSSGTAFAITKAGRLPAGTYTVQTVVLVGPDLASAHAYRAGETWEISVG